MGSNLKIGDIENREVLMNKKKQPVEIKRLDDGIVELRYYDNPSSDRYFSWKMPIHEANDLVRWWDNEGIRLKKRQLPVVDYRCGSVLISMNTQARVEVRAFDQYGRLKTLGYSLPRTVVECLGIWLQDAQQSQKSGNGKKVKTYSEKCFKSLIMGPRRVETRGRGDLRSKQVDVAQRQGYNPLVF